MAVVTNELFEVIDVLKNGGIGVLPTDTLYGIVASANDQQAVEKIYRVRPREAEKRCIVLIGDIEQMWDDLTPAQTEFVWSVWPGPYSIVLPSPKAPDWVTRGQGTVAYRLPDEDRLREFLRQTGPIIAPSANHPDDPPATSITVAKYYFDESVDFYVDGGEIYGHSPSTVVALHEDNSVEYLR